MTTKQILDELADRKAALAAERDKLRVLQDAIEDELEPTERALESLGEAIAALSELN